MIADITAPGPRLIHVDGVPVQAATGEPLDIAELRSLSLSDHEGWISLARSLQGQFAVIAIEAGLAVVITDLTGSYPVFILSGTDGAPRKVSTSLNELESDSKRSIRRSALFQYVAFGSMDLNQETIYTDVGRAAAGAVSFYSLTGRESKQEISHEYAPWREMTEPAERDPDRAAALLESLIRRYTDRWMSGLPASDPLGILLSGGTDSTLLAALLRNPFAQQGRLKCFTQHFRWERYSELAQARLNAQALGLETEAVMLGRSKHYAAVLALNSRLQDQPCVTTQAFNLWSLIQSVSTRCHAFMLGEHADSLFLGFGHFFHGLPAEASAYQSVTEAIPPKERLAWVAPRFVLDNNDRELLSALELPERDYREWFESFAQSRTARLAPFSDLSLSSLQQLSGQIDGGLNWQRIMLPVLRSTEGIRLLTPFFDAAVVSLALGLDASLKYRDGKTKFLLRRMLEKQIGKILMKKPAAASPVAIWRILPSERERLQITPSLRKYYDRLSRRSTLSLGRIANHHAKVAALGAWMNARNL